jgi:hypothetical protein
MDPGGLVRKGLPWQIVGRRGENLPHEDRKKGDFPAL